MDVRDRIRELSALPARLNIMLEQALFAVSDAPLRQDLCSVACVVSSATWQHWQAWRLPEDNRPEHEWAVFANVMKIAESENLGASDRRIATAFCFVHDTCFIKRIMEQEIRELEQGGFATRAAELREVKKHQRADHMQGGAENARWLLSQLRRPDDPSAALLSEQEIRRCVDIVSRHDLWKVDPPEPPPTRDRLAVVCLEGDVLWPLYPSGVLADLERPDGEGTSQDLFDPFKWRAQLEQSLATLVEFRRKWKGIPPDDFMDDESIFRTQEGHRLYSEWRTFWRL